MDSRGRERVRLGYVASCLTLGLSAGHTCRVANATPLRLEALLAQNLAELEQILLFNEANRIQVFRIGSSLVPLASHPVNRTRWWRTFGRDFAYLGRIATRSGQRLSMHPSPAGASLSSARPVVQQAARAELAYSARVLELLGQGPEGRVVLHVGGAAPDRVAALRAARMMLERLPEEIAARLALEHDDRVWTAREVLALAEAHGLPFVADTLHHAVLPSEPALSLAALLRRAARTWRAVGRPKIHLASQRPGARPGAHAGRIELRDARAAIVALPGPTDVMLEAKDKDLALFALREALGIGERAARIRAYARGEELTGQKASSSEAKK